MSRILVLGRSGQLASALAKRGFQMPDASFRFAGRGDCDIMAPGWSERLIDETRPSLVINTAAYTAVDAAEAEKEKARLINALVPAALAASCAAAGLPLVHTSTDYVFDGAARTPIDEHSATNPCNVYGLTKAEGERAVLKAGGEALVLRTAWLYSAIGRNFVTTMIELARQRDEIAVVDDQQGCPTSADDLADLILDLAQERLAGAIGRLDGLLHCAGETTASWADLASGVMTESARIGGPTAAIRRVATKDYPTAARRPAYTVLDCGRLERRYGRKLRGWPEALPVVVRQLLSGY